MIMGFSSWDLPVTRMAGRVCPRKNLVWSAVYGTEQFPAAGPFELEWEEEKGVNGSEIVSGSSLSLYHYRGRRCLLCGGRRYSSALCSSRLNQTLPW
jgi:hypothetical protein